jgi:hypothetical protein
MLQRFFLLLGLIFMISFSARAQDRLEMFGGFSFERYGGTPGRNISGWELAGNYKLKQTVGIVVDLDGHYGLASSLDARTLHLMAGPQLSFPGRISPFVHVLGGLGHVRSGSASTSFAGAIGGGIDIGIAPLVSWRVIQVDDVVTRFFGGTQNNMRFSTGVVIHF